MKFLLPLYGASILSVAILPGSMLSAQTRPAESPAGAQGDPSSSAEHAPDSVAHSAFLGVAVVETRAVTDAPGVSRPAQARVELTVSAVHPGSPAEVAGVKTGDVLVRLDEQYLLHPVQLQRLVGQMTIDQGVVLTVRRGDAMLTLEAELAARPAELKVPGRTPFPAPAVPGWPEEIERLLRIEPFGMERDPQELRRIQDLMQKRLDELLEDRLFEMPEMPRPPVPELGGAVRTQSVQVIDDGQHRLTVTSDAGGRHLKAVAADGTVLFDGPINSPQEREAVPEEVREKIPVPSIPRSEVVPAGRAV